jgi:hypothetical protein
MKKIKIIILSMMLILAISPIQLKAEPEPMRTSPAETVEAARARVLLNRLDEIQAMNKSSLSGQEKRHLRKEVRSIKKELSGGVYLSVGAIIIIVLLLILLL